MPAVRKALCQCHVHGCNRRIEVDEDTGEQVSGLWLPTKTHAVHQRDQLAWAHNHADTEDDVSTVVLAATISSQYVSDATVTRRQTQFDPVETSGCPPSPPPQQPVISSPQMQKLQTYQQDFVVAKSHFSTTGITLSFNTIPLSADERPPRLNYTNRQRSSNRQFLDHQERVRQLLENIDAVGTAGIDDTDEVRKVRGARKRLVEELQKHQSELDAIREEQWLQQKIAAGFGGQSEQKTVHDTC